MEQNVYEGRRGHKRLKAIERQIRRIESEISNDYEDTAEMVFLNEEIRWEGVAGLIFVMAFRKVHFMWNGLRDYGYIRLCKKWIKQHRIQAMTSADATEMVKSILTEEMCMELSEELDALEMI